MIDTRDRTIASIQYLRAIAALAVVHFHIFAMGAGTWPDGSVTKSHFGAAGVDLFFVISGFVMALTVSRSAAVSPAQFLLRRIRRVAPLYYIVTLFAFALMLLRPELFAHSVAGWGALLSSLLFLPVIDNGSIEVPILLVGWTLNYEMFFYALIAVLIACFDDRRLWLTFSVLVGLATAGLVYDDLHPLVGYYARPIMVEFAFGIACYWLWASGGLRRVPEAAGAALVAIGLAAIVVMPIDDASRWRFLAWGVPAAMVLLGALTMPQWRSRALHALGDWSYALYLTHIFVVSAMLKLFAASVAASGLPFMVLYAAVMAVAILVSALVYRSVERPLMAIAKGHRASLALMVSCLGGKPLGKSVGAPMK